MIPSVIVVGGGWAGLSCAVELVQSGCQVTILEAAPQLGGRARGIPFGEMTVDNGQHLLIGAYRHTLELLNKLGYPEHELFSRLPLRLLSNEGVDRQNGLTLPPYLPAPLNLAWGLLTMQGFGWSARFSALRFALRMRLRGFTLAEDQELGTLLRDCGQSSELIHKLWEPLCLATLNTPYEEASAQLFLNVLRDSFSRHARDTDILLPHGDIGQLMPVLASNWLKSRGVKIITGQRVTRLLHNSSAASGVACGEQQYLSDHTILACSLEESRRLLPKLPPLLPLQESLQAMDSYPITTIYLRYATEIQLPYPLYGLLGTHAQWLVDRTHCGQPNLLAVVISGPGPHMEMSRAMLAQTIISEVAERLPKLSQPLDSMIIKEKRATFRAIAGVNRYRPNHQTTLSGLWLAGDYTHGPYPATLEGAVQSGVQCARLITKR